MNSNIETIKTKLLVKYPFFGSVVANVTYKEDISLDTAGTDGKVIYYNPNFINSLTKDEQVFIFAHEVSHIALNHILRSKDKNQEIWNIAADAVINAFLKNDGLPIVDGGIEIEGAINYDTEQLYEELLKNNNSNNNGNENNSESSNNESSNDNDLENKSSENDKKQENNDVGHDTHSMWSKAVKKHKKQNSDNKNSNSSEEEKLEDEIKQKQEEVSKIGEKEAFKKNREEKKKQLEELKKGLTKDTAKFAGDSTASNTLDIYDIGYARPLIDWRYVLREAIKYDVDWSYRNATIEDGVVKANLEEQPMPETEILLDTSGSINEDLLKNFLRECKNILLHSRLRVGCFDTKFYGFQDIRNEYDIENMEFKGGGGTDFNAAVNAFSMRVENKIIFTDGWASMPKKKIDAIWLVFGGEKISPPGGKVINISDEQLRKLRFIDNNIYYRRRIK